MIMTKKICLCWDFNLPLSPILAFLLTSTLSLGLCRPNFFKKLQLPGSICSKAPFDGSTYPRWKLGSLGSNKEISCQPKLNRLYHWPVLPPFSWWSAIRPFFRYDPSKNEWTLTSKMPEPRFSMGICTYNNLIFLVGGCTHSRRHMQELVAYDPVSLIFWML